MTGNEQGIETMRRVATAVGVWASAQFGAGCSPQQIDNCLMGLLEETGEFTHAVLKMQQGIRGTPEEHKEAMKDAVADICVFLADLCERQSLDLGAAYEQALTRPRDTTIQLPENLRVMCFTLSSNIGKLRDGLIHRQVGGGSIYDQLNVILWVCNSFTYAMFGEPLWQVVERIWSEEVAKRDWKANAATGEASVAPTPAEPEVDAPLCYEDESGWRVSIDADLVGEAFIIRTFPQPVSGRQALSIGNVWTLPFVALYNAKYISLGDAGPVAFGRGEITLLLHVGAEGGRIERRADAEEVNRVLVGAFAPEHGFTTCTPVVPPLMVVDPAKGTVTPVAELKPVPDSPPTTLEQANDCIREVCDELAAFLITKNTSYGNAAFTPMTVFSEGSPLDRIRVRLDDKLGRIVRGRAFPGDNDREDLLGYLMLERAIIRFQQPTLGL